MTARTLRLAAEYRAAFLRTLDPRYAWGLADCLYELELLAVDGPREWRQG